MEECREIIIAFDEWFVSPLFFVFVFSRIFGERQNVISFIRCSLALSGIPLIFEHFHLVYSTPRYPFIIYYFLISKLSLLIWKIDAMPLFLSTYSCKSTREYPTRRCDTWHQLQLFIVSNEIIYAYA